MMTSIPALVVGSFFWFCLLTLIYIYAGYPILVFILARFKRGYHEEPGAVDTPPVTLLIAAYNEEAVIGNKIKNALSLDYPTDRLQILIAADGSNDRTVDVAGQFTGCNVTVCYQPKREGKSKAINRAIGLAEGEIILFSDANNHYSPDILRRLVPFFQNDCVGGVSGAKHIGEGDTVLGDSEGLYWKYESFIKNQESRLQSCVAVAGEVLAIRKSLFEPIPSNIINDDFFIAMTILEKGYEIKYTPQAKSYERISQTAANEKERRARMMAGLVQSIPLTLQPALLKHPLVVWQVISHKFMRIAIPFTMIGMLLSNLLLVLLPGSTLGTPLQRIITLTAPLNGLFLAAQILFYGLAWIGSFVQLKGRLGKILYLPQFLFNSNYATLIGLLRFLQKRQTVLWTKAERK